MIMRHHRVAGTECRTEAFTFTFILEGPLLGNGGEQMDIFYGSIVK